MLRQQKPLHNNLAQILSGLVKQHYKLTVLQHGQGRLRCHNIGDVLGDTSSQPSVFTAASEDAFEKDPSTVFVFIITVEQVKFICVANATKAAFALFFLRSGRSLNSAPAR